MTALEAVAAKLPVIFSNVEGLKEISKTFEKKRLFKNGDSEELVNCILEVLKNSDNLKEECEKNFISAKKKFSTKKQINLINTIYYELLN